MCAYEFYTYDDYKQWEGEWELIDGIPHAMAPAPVISHQLLATEIAFEFRKNLEECEKCFVVMEEDYKVDEYTVLKPDVSVICNQMGDYIVKAPEVIVEVISPSTAKRDEKTKFKIYEEEGVKYYILIYPNDLKAKVYKLDNHKYIKEGDFSDEVYKFENLTCDMEVNFENVFKKIKRLKR
jgi:Uma2 family endonuclease